MIEDLSKANVSLKRHNDLLEKEIELIKKKYEDLQLQYDIVEQGRCRFKRELKEKNEQIVLLEKIKVKQDNEIERLEKTKVKQKYEIERLSNAIDEFEKIKKCNCKCSKKADENKPVSNDNDDSKGKKTVAKKRTTRKVKKDKAKD